MLQKTIIFAGTPEFSVPALRATIDWCQSRDYQLQVLTQPDRRAGRGRKLSASPVKQVAEAAGVAVTQPTTLKKGAIRKQIVDWQPQIMIVAAYGLILPSTILEIPEHGCINLHASLLPRWRGAAPIQRAIAAGDRVSGISLMQMDAGLDTGPVFLQRPLTLAPYETAGSLHDRLAAQGASMLTEHLDVLLSGELTPRPQLHDYATYAAKLNKEEAIIDWQQPAAILAQKIRAFNPWPVAQTKASTDWGDVSLRLWEARDVADATTAKPGQVIGEGPAGIEVATGAGRLLIQKLQRPGGQALPASEFINAHSLEKATFS